MAHKALAALLVVVIVGGGVTATVFVPRALANDQPTEPTTIEITTEETTEETTLEIITQEETTEAPTETSTAATTATTTIKLTGVVELSPIMCEPDRQLAAKLGFLTSGPDESANSFRSFVTADNLSSFNIFDRDNILRYEFMISTPTISFYGIKVGDSLDITKIPARAYDSAEKKDNSYVLMKGEDKYQFGADENGIVTMIALRYIVP